MHPSLCLKYCPFCGSPKFIFDGSKKFRCEDCGHLHYINAAAAVAVLIYNEKGELLLARRALDPSKGMLDLPGGFVDPLETVEEAVRREVREELNVGLNELRYLCSYPNEYLFDGMIIYTADMFFTATVRDFSNLRPADDVAAVEFYAPGAIPLEEVAFASIRKVLSEVN